MKSRRTTEFWEWFASVASALATDPKDSKIILELEARLGEINPRLSWEIGPGSVAPWALVISPNLEPELRADAMGVALAAPTIPGWQFLGSRPPKLWDYSFEIERDSGEFAQVDASTWTFVLLRYPDLQYEILLSGHVVPNATESEKWQAATVVLESILGEDKLMDLQGSYELIAEMDRQFVAKQRPIQQLSSAFPKLPPG